MNNDARSSERRYQLVPGREWDLRSQNKGLVNFERRRKKRKIRAGLGAVWGRGAVV